MMDYATAKDLARAHGLATRQIPGIMVAEVLLHHDGTLFTDTIFACVGYCQKCDSYWQVFRQEKSLIIEVVDVGSSEPPSPPEAEVLPHQA